MTRFSAPFPSSSLEQSKIALIISTADRAIEQTSALLAKQERIRVGLLNDLLTRGIGEDGNLRSEQSHEFKDSHAGRIPKQSTLFSVGELLRQRPKNGYSPQEADAWTGTWMLGLGCLTASGFVPRQLKAAPTNDPALANTLLCDGDLI